jgi:hypothetical protein
MTLMKTSAKHAQTVVGLAHEFVRCYIKIRRSGTNKIIDDKISKAHTLKEWAVTPGEDVKFAAGEDQQMMTGWVGSETKVNGGHKVGFLVFVPSGGGKGNWWRVPTKDISKADGAAAGVDEGLNDTELMALFNSVENDSEMSEVSSDEADEDYDENADGPSSGSDADDADDA